MLFSYLCYFNNEVYSISTFYNQIYNLNTFFMKNFALKNPNLVNGIFRFFFLPKNILFVCNRILFGFPLLGNR